MYNEKIKQFSLKGWLYLGIFYFVWIICVQILNLSQFFSRDWYMYKAFCCLLKIYKCLLTPNYTQSHSVTYPNSIKLCFVCWRGGKVLCFLTLCNNLKKNCFLWYLSAVQFIVCSLNLSFVLLSQCDNKEHFIERIKEMDLEVQRSLVEHIQQVGYM